MRNGATRNGKFIAVANMKGGVGKTTTVVSLAEALAADDQTKKILIIDLDPQASASVAVAGDDNLDRMIQQDETIEAFLRKRLIEKDKDAKLDAMIHPTICATMHRGDQLSVALLPCGPGLRRVEREMTWELAKTNLPFTSADGHITKLFKSDILPLAKHYDYILFDCAPGISPVTEIAVRLSDLVIVPTIPDRLSVYGLNAFYETIWDTQTRYLPPAKAKPTILIVRVDRRVIQHREVLEALKERVLVGNAGYALMESQIPTSAALVAALMMGGFPTFTQKYTSNVISDILSPLVGEVKGIL